MAKLSLSNADCAILVFSLTDKVYMVQFYQIKISKYIALFEKYL